MQEIDGMLEKEETVEGLSQYWKLHRQFDVFLENLKEANVAGSTKPTLPSCVFSTSLKGQLCHLFRLQTRRYVRNFKRI